MTEMNQTFGKKVFLLFAAALSFSVYAQEGKKEVAYQPVTRKQVVYQEPSNKSANPMAISENKVAFIRDVVKSYVDFKDDITNQTVINMIYDQIEKEFPIQLEGKPDNRSIQDLRKEVMRSVQKDFPYSEAAYRKMLQEKAEKLYQTCNEGEKIVLTYIKGKKRYKIHDIFYKFNGNTVSIGLKTIPFYDLIEEDKVRVSKTYALKKQDAYVSKALSDYLYRRREALLTAETTLVKKQIQDNISAGFVKYAEEWRYPIQVINIRLIENIESDSRYTGKITGLDLNSIQRIQIKSATDLINKSELEQRIQRRKENAAKHAGSIDSEQGFFNLVFWGFTRDEVKLVLEKQGLNFIPGKEYDRAVVSDRQIREVRLYYGNSGLEKVVTIYNIRNIDALMKIKRNMNQKYGPDNESKEKKYVRPGDPVSWKGLITDGYLYVKQNPQSGAIEEDITMTLKVVPREERQKRQKIIDARKTK